MAKVLCVLYDDPIDGYPKTYARDDIPKIESYPGGQTAPTPQGIDFTPGHLLGSVSGELGLRGYLESQGHTLVVTSDKDRDGSVFDQELVDADIVISQPFWPAVPDGRAHREGQEPEARHHGRHRFRPRRPRRGHRQGCDRRRGHVLQQHQRRRARRDDDAGPGTQLPAVEQDRPGRRLEHRRRRRPLVRPGGHAGRHRRRRPHRPRGAAPPRPLRRRPALHRPSPSPGGHRAGAEPDLARERRGHGPALRRRHHQRAPPPGDRGPVRRRAALQDEARHVPHQHRAGEDHRPRRDRTRAGERPAHAATRATCGTRSPPRPTTRGGPCRTTA